jgi:hypothetical protein
MGHVVHFGASGERNFDALFFMLGWDQHVFRKKRAGARYGKLLFLHPVGSTGHVVHSGVPRPQNVNTLFVILGWDHYGFHKMRTGTHYTELVFYIRWDLWVL